MMGKFDMFTKARFVFALAASSSLVVACGGGSSTPAAPPTPTPMANVTFNVVVPASNSASARMRPAYISPGSQSVTIQLVAPPPATPAPVVVINLQAGASDCTSTSSGSICSAVLSVPVAQQEFVVSVYQGPGGTGALLSKGAITINVQSGGTAATISNSVSLTLNGIVASLQLAIAPTQGQVGVKQTYELTVMAFDPSGSIIVGPGNYSLPITLQIDDPNGYFAGAFTTQPVYAPGPPISIAYQGTGLSAPQGGTVTFTATASGVPAETSAITLAPASVPTTGPTPTPGITPTPVPTVSIAPSTPPPTPTPQFNVSPSTLTFAGVAPQPAQTFTASEQGVTSFTARSADSSIATVSGSGTTFTINAGSQSGQTLITVTDSNNRNATVTAIVSGQTIIIQSKSRKNHR